MLVRNQHVKMKQTGVMLIQSGIVTKNVNLVLVTHVGMFASKLVIDVILPHAKVIFIKLVVSMTYQLILNLKKAFAANFQIQSEQVFLDIQYWLEYCPTLLKTMLKTNFLLQFRTKN